MGISLSKLSQHKAFYLWLKQTRKESSVRGILQNLEYFLRKTNSPYPTVESITDFMYDLQLNGMKGTYINHYRSAALTYTKYLEEKGLPYDPLIRNIKQVKEVKPNKATMSDEEIEQFLSLPNECWQKHSKTKKLMKRSYGKGYDVWTLFFSILAFSGMRPTEVAHLTPDTVDFGRNIFILLDTKTHDNRNVPIAKNLVEPLMKHMENLESGAYLFPSLRGGDDRGMGKVVDNTDWCYNFHTRIKRMGIKRSNLTVYSLRHSFITRMLGEDVNIFKVQKIVGHKRMETTAMYTHLSTKDVQKAILKDPLYTRSNPEGKLAYLKEAIKGLVVDNPHHLIFTIKETPTSFAFEVALANDTTK